MIQFLLQNSYFQFSLSTFLFLFFRENADKRAFISAIGILGIIKDRKHLEELFLTQGIILVIVALRAGNGRAHPRGHGGIHSIDHGDVSKFLIIRASFAIGLSVSMKSGGNELVVGWLGKQVAGQLLARKLIKREIAVKRADNPVAIGPNCARLIIGIARTVSITRKIQPLPRPVLAISRLGQ